MNDADINQVYQERERRLAGGLARQVRVDVRKSWDRAHQQGLHPDRHLPIVALNGDEVQQQRSEGGLAAVWPTVVATLGSAAAEPGHLLFGADAHGHLLWVMGDPATSRVAERANLVAGARWSEQAAGTSGVGTALALGKPFQIRGPEHYLSVAVDFTCTAAPIRDPASGAVIGVVDVTCRNRDTRPLALPLVIAAAQLAEARLAELHWRRDAQIRARYLERVVRRSGDRVALLAPDGRVVHSEPASWLPSAWPLPPQEGALTFPDGRHVIIERLSPGGPFAVYSSHHNDQVARISALGRKYAQFQVDGIPQRLGLRHSEIVVLLLANPEGLTAEALAREVYGEGGKPGTVRAELARLRGLLGFRLAANPYRLIGITADFLDFSQAVTADGTPILPECDPALLLPSSQAPGIVRLRERLRQQAAAAVPAG